MRHSGNGTINNNNENDNNNNTDEINDDDDNNIIPVVRVLFDGLRHSAVPCKNFDVIKTAGEPKNFMSDVVYFEWKRTGGGGRGRLVKSIDTMHRFRCSLQRERDRSNNSTLGRGGACRARQRQEHKY